MSANISILLSSPRLVSFGRGLADWLIWPTAGLIDRLIATGLEYWRGRQTRQVLSAMDDRMLADIGLRRSEIATAVHERARYRLPRHDAMT